MTPLHAQRCRARLGRATVNCLASRKGAASLACVILMVVWQITLVGAILPDCRNQDTTLQRLDTVRAFYAAEGGMNMAIREVFSNEDIDADGGIGSISNTGSPTDDPDIGPGRVYVVTSESGGITTLVSRGRSGSARRQITTDVE
jgi:hypothetical protein